jgi:hypothetical protein
MINAQHCLQWINQMSSVIFRTIDTVPLKSKSSISILFFVLFLFVSVLFFRFFFHMFVEFCVSAYRCEFWQTRSALDFFLHEFLLDFLLEFIAIFISMPPFIYGADNLFLWSMTSFERNKLCSSKWREIKKH